MKLPCCPHINVSIIYKEKDGNVFDRICLFVLLDIYLSLSNAVNCNFTMMGTSPETSAYNFVVNIYD